MDRQEAVRVLLMEMRKALANPDGMPQVCVNSRVENLSQYLATQVLSQALPSDQLLQLC